MSRFAKINPASGKIHKPHRHNNRVFCRQKLDAVCAQPHEVWAAPNADFCKRCFRNLEDVARARAKYGKNAP